MDKLGRVFLSYVKEVACKSEVQASTRSFHSTVALDPGSSDIYNLSMPQMELEASGVKGI